MKHFCHLSSLPIKVKYVKLHIITLQEDELNVGIRFSSLPLCHKDDHTHTPTNEQFVVVSIKL